MRNHEKNNEEFKKALEDILQPAFVKTSAGTASSRQVFTAEPLSKHQDERKRITSTNLSINSANFCRHLLYR
jgi:hypothetical protein